MKEITVSADDIRIVVSTQEGELTFDKSENAVELSGTVDYATFNRLVKSLKRAVSRESFSADPLGDE